MRWSKESGRSPYVVQLANSRFWQIVSSNNAVVGGRKVREVSKRKKKRLWYLQVRRMSVVGFIVRWFQLASETVADEGSTIANFLMKPYVAR